MAAAVPATAEEGEVEAALPMDAAARGEEEDEGMVQLLSLSLLLVLPADCATLGAAPPDAD